LQIYGNSAQCPVKEVAFWLNNMNANFNGAWSDYQYGEITFCGTDPSRYTVPTARQHKTAFL
jgi:hypothetical protein